MAAKQRPPARGSGVNPPSRFDAIHAEADLEHLAYELTEEPPASPLTQFLDDDAQSIISENDSPDLGFRYSLNPYRGCEHGCSYCYARPYHEYLGFSGGLDFETKILVKRRAPELLRAWLAKGGGHGEVLMLSGVTDCYQPIERKLGLTRRCLEELLQAKHPVAIITKNALIARDLDVLRDLAAEKLVHVRISLTTLDAELARDLEPRTSAPAAKLRTIRQLADAGVPVGVMMAPIIPGLTDSHIPSVLQQVRDAGAQSAGYTLLRLSGVVRPVFLDWLARHRPTAASRVEAFVRATRDGKLNDTRFGARMRGTGEVAGQIRQTFEVFLAKYGLDGRLPPMDFSRFVAPEKPVAADAQGRVQRRLWD
jgi:DNA repair photolyase